MLRRTRSDNGKGHVAVKAAWHLFCLKVSEDYRRRIHGVRFAGIAGLLVALFITASPASDFNSLAKASCTVEVTFTVAPIISMDAVIYNRDGSIADPQAITWDRSQLIPGHTKWLCSQQYILISATLTAVSSGIQIYTNNCAPDADPQFYDINPSTEDPAGLVKVSTRDKTLKLCWRLTDSPTDTLEISEKLVGPSLKLYNPRLGDGYYCFLWMKDASTPDQPDTSENERFVPGEDYVTFRDELRGCHHAEGSWSSMNSPYYLYLGADFGDSEISEIYETNTLCIEAFCE